MSNTAAENSVPGILEVARLVIDAAEAVGIDYMLGGALATAAWILPRTTQDVDFAVSLPSEQMERFSRALLARGINIPADLMQQVQEEVRGDVPLVGYHLPSVIKVEFFLQRPGDELRATALARRRQVDLGSPLGEAYVHTPEDLILYKLRCWDLSRQAKHVRDIGLMLVALEDRLDLPYLDRWVETLGLQTAWRCMRTAAAGGDLPQR